MGISRCSPLTCLLQSFLFFFIGNFFILILIVIVSVIIYIIIRKRETNRLVTFKQTIALFTSIVLICIALLFLGRVVQTVVVTQGVLNWPVYSCVVLNSTGHCIEDAAYASIPEPDEQGIIDFSIPHRVCNLHSSILNSPEICRERVCDNLYTPTTYLKNEVSSKVESKVKQRCYENKSYGN